MQSDSSMEPPITAKASKSHLRKQRMKLILALVFPNFLAAADATMVAPAVELISRHFGQLEGAFSWLVTAYTLTNTAFSPLSDQIADHYGRHAAMQFHIFWLLVGSVLSAAANNWPVMLLGRALQGIGASGVQNLTDIILTDDVDLDESAKNNTIFTLISGLGYSVGPILGGYIANAGWRYLFVFSVGIAFISHIFVFLMLRKTLRPGSIDRSRRGYIEGLETFDWVGIVMFLVGTGLLVLGVSWGGTEYAWHHSATIVPLVLGGVLFAAFFGYEYLFEDDRVVARIFPKQSAMIPFSVFRKKDTLLLSSINFATGAALFSAFYFISLYWTLAEGRSAARTGLELTFYIPGLGGGVMLAMWMVNSWPAQTFHPLLLGSIVEAVGLGVLALAVRDRQISLVRGMLAMSGAGSGLRFMPAILHVTGLWAQDKRARVLSFLSFCVPFGGTISIAMMGSVFTNKLRTYLTEASLSFGQQELDSSALQDNFDFSSIPEEIRTTIQNAAARSIMWAFVSILPFMVVSAIASIFLGNVWIQEKAGTGEDAAARVVEGFYIRSWFQLGSSRHAERSHATDKLQEDGKAESSGQETSRSEK